MPRNFANDNARYHLKTPPHMHPYQILQSVCAMHARRKREREQKRKEEELQQEEDEIVAMAKKAKFPSYFQNNKKRALASKQS